MAIVDKIPFQFITGIMSLIIVPWFTFRYQKSSVKHKHRIFKFKDEILINLNDFRYVNLIGPVVIFFLTSISYFTQEQSLFLVINLIFSILLSANFLFMYRHIKEIKKVHPPNIGQSLSNKIKNIFINYVKSLFIMISASLLNVLLLLIVREISYYYDKPHEIHTAITAIIVLYIYIGFLVYILNSSYASRLTKIVKRVTIYYSQNGKVESGQNIKFDEFDINRHYTSFYSEDKNNKTVFYKTVFPTKDLLRIEYYYD